MSKLVEMTSKDDVFTKYTGSCSYTIEGKGQMWYKNGSFYDGEFKNGMKDGIGVFIWKNSIKYDGLFRTDKFIRGTMICQNFEYKGDVQNNVPHGFGVGKRTKDKGRLAKWEGKFEHGSFVQGTYDDGETKKVGNFKNGLIQGQGFIEKKDGRRWEGIWKDNFLEAGSYNGRECEDERSDEKWGFLHFKIMSQIIQFKSDKRIFHKIKIVSGFLKDKSCLMKIEWIPASSCKEKSNDDKVDGCWKINTIFVEEDKFENVLEKLSGKRVRKEKSVGAEKNESAVCEDFKKRKRDEDDMDAAWNVVFELAQQKSDK